MDWINHTPYPAKLFRTGIDADRFAAAAIARITYEVDAAGLATPSAEQTWEVSFKSLDTSFGPRYSDELFRKGGIDLLVYGKAISRTPVQEMEVEVEIPGKLSRRLKVFGNRKWESSAAGLRPSQAEEFTEMPLTLHEAFGGKAEWDGIEIPHFHNPLGKGYYIEEAQAFEQPLPNVEDPHKLIHFWDDRPDPVGFVQCPNSELRARNNLELDAKGNIAKIRPKFFNQAFPDMIVEQLEPGELIHVKGMNSKGIFRFRIPECPLYMQLALGPRVQERKLVIDEVALFPDQSQAFVTYRFPFRYVFQPREIRTCELFSHESIQFV